MAEEFSKKEKESTIFCDYEFGDLKEVIVGVSSGKLPSLSAPWYKKTLEVLPKNEADIALERAGLNFKELRYPYLGNKSEYELLEAESQELIKVLKSLGVKVYRLDEVDEDFIANHYGKELLGNGFAQDFPRDNLIITGNKVIECFLNTKIRKMDIMGFKTILSEKCDETVKYVSMPQVPLYNDNNKYPLLEGGDIVIIGKTVLVGNSLNPEVGSNELGYLWLKNYLGEEYNVIRVPLREDFLHLDCCLSLPRRKLAIICKDAFVEGIPDVIKDYDFIEVSVDDSRRLAVNGLPVNEHNYIMSYNSHVNNEHVEKELTKRGIKVHKIYYETHNWQGGSIRCSTQALKRELK